MNIYLDPVFKDRLINKNIYKVNDINYFDILELKEESKINNKYQNEGNQLKSKLIIIKIKALI